MREFNRDFFVGWLTGVVSILAAIAIGLLLSCCAPATTGNELPTPAGPPAPIKAVYEYPLSETIDIDRPATYPPMPDSEFSYVEPGWAGSRVHYTTEGDLSAVLSSGSSRTIGRTPQSTVLMFSDGTGLVSLCRFWPAVEDGPVLVDYSVPPGMTCKDTTTVLVHQIEEAY